MLHLLDKKGCSGWHQGGGAQGGIEYDRQGLEWVRDMESIAMLWQ